MGMNHQPLDSGDDESVASHTEDTKQTSHGKRVFNHARKEDGSLGRGFIRKRSFLDIADDVSVDAGDIRGSH